MNNDLISREALKKTITQNREIDRNAVCDVLDIIDNAPTVDKKPFALFSFDKEELNRIVDEQVIKPIENGELVLKKEERPTGHWIPKVCNFYWYRQFACSECEHEIISAKGLPNYCQNCGAKMKGIYNEQKTADTSL